MEFAPPNVHVKQVRSSATAAQPTQTARMFCCVSSVSVVGFPYPTAEFQAKGVWRLHETKIVPSRQIWIEKMVSTPADSKLATLRCKGLLLLLARVEPQSSFIAAPGFWFYRGDNYSDAVGGVPL